MAILNLRLCPQPGVPFLCFNFLHGILFWDFSNTWQTINVNLLAQGQLFA
jgi:hypothetical protein